jgi:hypothetical protein
MQYTLNHKDGIITLAINKANTIKNKIENGELISRECGDCKSFLHINSFDSRVRDGKRQIHTKCIQCHKIRKLVKNSYKRFGKDSSTEQIIGISYKGFIEWLDKGDLKHTDKGLHIDHCVPQSLGQNQDDLAILNHYSNLQLMNSKANMQKSNKYIYKEQLTITLAKSPNSKRLLELIKQSGIVII